MRNNYYDVSKLNAPYRQQLSVQGLGSNGVFAGSIGMIMHDLGDNEITREGYDTIAEDIESQREELEGRIQSLEQQKVELRDRINILQDEIRAIEEDMNNPYLSREETQYYESYKNDRSMEINQINQEISYIDNEIFGLRNEQNRLSGEREAILEEKEAILEEKEAVHEHQPKVITKNVVHPEETLTYVEPKTNQIPWTMIGILVGVGAIGYAAYSRRKKSRKAM